MEDAATGIQPAEELPDTFYGKNYGRIPIGTPATPGMSYAEMLEADPGAIPPATNFPGNYTPKPRRVDYSRYWDPRIAKLEDEHIWAKHWLAAGRLEDVPNIGDRIVFDIRDKSYLIVRTSETEIKAYHNTCRHRGRALCDETSGTGTHIRCPFHGWTFNLDGSVAWIPGEADFPVKDRRGMALAEVKVAMWGGHIFINADPDCEPLEKALGPLIDLFADFPLENRYTILWLQKKIRANWKTVMEIFQEGYHTTETHWDSLAIFGETETTYDCWKGDGYHVSRLITPTGVPSGYLRDKVTVRMMVEQYTKLYCSREAEPGRGETLPDARTYLADMKRETLSAEYGVNLPEGTNSLLLDFVKFYMFPNFHPWWGEQWPISYRFIPIGTNPEECMMEIRLTAPIPPGKKAPPPVAPLVLDFDEDCTGHPELAYTGHIADQDVAHMEKLQKGMRAARTDKAAPILALYQEKQITYFHETYDRLLGLKTGPIT